MTTIHSTHWSSLPMHKVACAKQLPCMKLHRRINSPRRPPAVADIVYGRCGGCFCTSSRQYRWELGRRCSHPAARQRVFWASPHRLHRCDVTMTAPAGRRRGLQMRCWAVRLMNWPESRESTERDRKVGKVPRGTGKGGIGDPGVVIWRARSARCDDDRLF